MSRWNLYLRVFSVLPALFHIFGMTQCAELHGGGVHDDVAECNADHVIVVNGADADAVQVGQRHH